MTHPDEDALLSFVLETLDEPDYSTVREHLSVCPHCIGLENELREELSRLKSAAFRIDLPAPPLHVRRESFPRAALRLAAVLAIGFLLGYMTAMLSAPDRPIVVQQRLIPAAGVVISRGYVTCPAVDLTPAPVSRENVE